MQENNKSEGHGLGIASLVTSLLGLHLIGLILGIIGLNKSKKQNQKNGLALAGIIISSIGLVLTCVIIFLVFMSIPAQQRSVRDTARKSIVSRYSSDEAEYQANNLGKMPMASDISRSYSTVTSITDGGTPTQDSASYIVGKNCEGVSSDRNYSVTILLEKGTEYCVGS